VGAGVWNPHRPWAIIHRRNPPLTGTIVDTSIAKHIITAGPWTATIAARGAELCSLTLDGQGELIWQAGAVWPRHAPNLFPIVGRLAGDTLIHRGQSYPLSQHGFARDLDFAWVELGAGFCRMVLTDNEATRARYPFAFNLEVAYRLDAQAGLSQTYRLRNCGHEPLPASIGAHPAFRWPLDLDAPKTAHWLRFDRPEPAPARRLKGGLLAPERVESPIKGDLLALDDALFEADALILDRVASRGLVYGGPAFALRIGWEGFDQLGLWSKGGGEFLCIEPWSGFASPAGFTGEFKDKPGVFTIEPGAVRQFTLRVGAVS
jgi:galactose mutarotase-like enzyme